MKLFRATYAKSRSVDVFLHTILLSQALELSHSKFYNYMGCIYFQICCPLWDQIKLDWIENQFTPFVSGGN